MLARVTLRQILTQRRVRKKKLRKEDLGYRKPFLKREALYKD